MTATAPTSELGRAEFLNRLLDDLQACLNAGAAQKLIALRLPAESQKLIEDLGQKKSQGTITPEEQADYQVFVNAMSFVSLLQKRAKRVLA